MVREELVENGGRIRHYSDANMKIEQIETGILYDDAVDVLPCAYTYVETVGAIMVMAVLVQKFREVSTRRLL